MNRYLIMAIMVLVGLLGVAGYQLKQEIKYSAKVEQTLEDTQRSFDMVLDTVNTNIEELNQTRTKVRALEIVNRNARTKLESMKDRTDVVKAKPTLVARRINGSFDGLLQNIACQTGDRSSCSTP